MKLINRGIHTRVTNLVSPHEEEIAFRKKKKNR